MNQFTVNQFMVNQFTVNQFTVNQFTVNQFMVNQFMVNQFMVNQFMVNQFMVNQFMVNQFIWTSSCISGLSSGMKTVKKRFPSPGDGAGAGKAAAPSPLKNTGGLRKMRLNYEWWTLRRLTERPRCSLEPSMSCIPLRGDPICGACYERDAAKEARLGADS